MYGISIQLSHWAADSAPYSIHRHSNGRADIATKSMENYYFRKISVITYGLNARQMNQIIYIYIYIKWIKKRTANKQKL